MHGEWATVPIRTTFRERDNVAHSRPVRADERQRTVRPPFAASVVGASAAEAHRANAEPFLVEKKPS